MDTDLETEFKEAYKEWVSKYPCLCSPEENKEGCCMRGRAWARYCMARDILMEFRNKEMTRYLDARLVN